MPQPKPKKSESKKKFLNRCMGDDVMAKEYDDDKQRYAVCNQIWKDKGENNAMGNKDITQDLERRFIPATEVRVIRANDNEKPVFEGYAALFNNWSEDLGGFRERIKPGAFKKALKNSDTRALVNHDANFVLGRTRSKTLELKEDAKGLFFRAKPPETQWAKDYMESVKRGDIDQCSFGFIVAKGGDEWEESDKGLAERTLTEIAELPDVSIVTYPAYTNTTVALRNMEQWRDSRDSEDDVEPEPDEAKQTLDEAALAKRNRELRERELQMRQIGDK